GFGYANATEYQGAGPETIVVAMYGRPQALGLAVPTDTPTPAVAAQEKEVTKVAALSGSRLPWAPFAIGIISGGAVMGLMINHGFRIRRLVRRGEKYFV